MSLTRGSVAAYEQGFRAVMAKQKVIVDTGLTYYPFGAGGLADRALIHERQLAAVDKRVPFPIAAVLGCGVVTGAGSILAEVLRSSRACPRTPVGPSDTTMLRNPTSGSSCDDHADAPVNRRTFCARPGCPD